MVEAGTKWIRKEVEVSPVVAAACISTIVSIGLQPIEKKLVIDQLLQSNKSSSKGFLGPFQDILQYGKTNGVRQLYKGFVPLAAREFIYIAAISVVNPLIVSMVDHQLNSFQHRTVPEAFGAFSVGFCAGMISAPCQTVNAMMKDERNKYKSLSTLLKDNIFGNGFQSGTKRLFFGAATRSARCGGAGVLYYTWRNILAATD